MKDSNITIQELKGEVKKFIDERDWNKFHNPKELATSINLESSELVELFLWKKHEELQDYMGDDEFIIKIKEELADIIINCLSFSNQMEIDLSEAVMKKLELNKVKYPINVVKGRAYKHTKKGELKKL